jgi:hypothetical protein
MKDETDFLAWAVAIYAAAAVVLALDLFVWRPF